jgi:hypothetical protein
MPAGDSVTRWLNQFQERDPAAAQRSWVRYLVRLVGLARQGGRPVSWAAAGRGGGVLSLDSASTRVPSPTRREQGPRPFATGPMLCREVDPCN